MDSDSVFAIQTELYEFLTKFLVNIKKDGADRKTIELYKRKADTVDAHWQDYLKNHSKMCEFSDFDHVYFTKSCFDTAQGVYLDIKKIIDNTLAQLEVKQLLGVSPRKPEAAAPRTQVSPSYRQEMAVPQHLAGPSYYPETSSRREEFPSRVSKHKELSDLVKRQNINFKAFMRTVSNINVDNFENKWQFENALKSLDSRWGEIDKLHWEIEGEGGCDEIAYQSEFCSYEKTYNELTNNINQKMWSVKHREKSTPQINIPVFNGLYSNWVSFKDLFSEAIDKNPSMSNAQKMQFLKSKVVGEAERLIHHLQISSDNYQVCWDIFKHRYGNKKMIFTSHINILLGLPTMQQQSVTMIKRLHDVTKESLHAIQNLGVDTATWDPLLVHLLAQKLDNESFLEYIESIKNPRELPSLQEFLEYLEVKFTALEASRRKQEPTNHKTTSSQPTKTNNQHQNHKKFYQKNNCNSYNKDYSNSKMNTCHISRTLTCVLCNAEHGLWRCPEFMQMTHEQRINKIEQLNYCKNCLINHFKKPCLSIKKCRKCLDTHNTLLHEAITSQSPSTSADVTNKNTNNSATKKSPSRSSHASWNDLSEILLATAIIYVKGADGTLYKMRALIDQGSQLSLINENAAQTLGLKRTQFKGQIFGVGEKENNSKGMLHITIQSVHSDFSFETSVIVMNNVVKRLPNNTFNKPSSWIHIQGINLADPEFYISRPVDLLLGADIYSKIMLGGILRGDKREQPIAQQTQLGWLLCGSMRPHYQCNVVLNNTKELLKFWENEDIHQKIEMSHEDHECLQYFFKTTKRLENGTYEVRLPFKPELKDKLSVTKPQALAQYINLEKKLQKNPELKLNYQKFMDEYISLNHMIPTNTNHTIECYLPHHAATRTESTTTKLRVVFNASAKSSSGYSLNDLMYRGPNIQKDIQELILKWRQYRFAYTSDIEKMYRMIHVHPEDQVYQKILWRRPYEEIRSFQLVTLTYGTKPAGFLAMMCLKQLARDEGQKFPEAAKQLEESFYMDDYCGGGHQINSAKKLKSDLIQLLKLGGFNLRKWTANEPDLLLDLNPEQCNQSTFEFKQGDATKTLGLGWNPQRDKFIFKSKIETDPHKIPTKRSLLSDISKLFDPLGWLTPLSTTMKVLFQNVWLTKLKWDEHLPEQINAEWTNLKQELSEIACIEVDRWLGTGENQNIEFHGFYDASNKAYACVIYCRVVKEAETTITMIAGKARLAPLSKSVSTPRLELIGAQLLSQLMEKVQGCLSDYQSYIYCWTDSTAVLGWIQGDPARWKPFVANRVKAITKTISPEHWRYVNTNENPADCASRGLTVKQLKNYDLWWKGPSWLSKFTNQENQNIFETNLETKSAHKMTNAVISKQKRESMLVEIVKELLRRFSSFSKINRILAWILRLTISRKQVRRTYLDLHELRRAKLLIIQSVQGMEFADDLTFINKHGKVHCKSKILNLNPFIDDQDILRVGGRLEHAHISQEMKHPVILPHDHLLTTLLIDQAHHLTLHGGVRMTLANLRQQYWIIGGYMATKEFIRKCVTCRRHTPLRQYQLMGDLPESRVNPEHAFYHCGVDFTGFVEVKANKGRGIRTTKGYISVFVCMVTKAVHLELVSDLSTSAFLAALARMAARRGAPRHIYSDNGTNFVGANRMLQEEHKQLLEVFDNSFQTEISEMGIEWHRNAPNWPNAGGIWERAVRSLKHHLKRVVGTQKLTFEEYTTLLAKLEACLNSRPLCALSEDPDDLNFLTPAHFLSGRPGLTILETEQDARTRWHLTTKLFQDLWRRWKSEYLVQLSSRPKWTEKQKGINVDDLVVIHNENLPPGKWALGRVIQTHPGSDGLTRTVSLKTANGTIVRPIVKLSLLPVNQGDKPKPDTTPAAGPSVRKEKPKFKVSAIATALLIFMSLVSPSYSLHSIKPLPDNRTLYFDPISKIQLIRDKWTVVMYYDMGPYWTGIDTYNKISKYSEALCATIEIESHCNTIVQQARHDYQELEYYNELLLTQHFSVYDGRREGQTVRRRRGLINGVGYLANDLFGVLDSRFADQYEKGIETIQRNENHLSNLWKNQTSVVEAEFNLMKKMETTVSKQHKLINRKLTELKDNYSTVQREIQNISYVNDFTLSAMTGNSLLHGLRRLQDMLLDTITDIYHGHLSIHLLPPTQLKRELQIIYSKMPSDLTLPIEDIDKDLQYIYKLFKVKARATRKYVIIEVSFPLITREGFQLYKIIPVPHQTKSAMASLIPISEYVAVNLQKDSYFTITMTELTTCLHHGSAYMCPLLSPIRDLNNDENFCQVTPDKKECKVEQTSCFNKWVDLHLMSQRFYFCCDTYTIKIICGDQMTVRQLSRAGVIAISEECVIKGKDFALYSIRQQSSSTNITPSIYIPEFDQINHLINIKIPVENKTVDEDLSSDMTNLGRAVDQLKSSDAEMDHISTHDIHHYVISYALVLVTLCAMAVWMWRTGRCRPIRRRKTADQRTRQHQVESNRPGITARLQYRGQRLHHQELLDVSPPPKQQTSAPVYSEISEVFSPSSSGLVLNPGELVGKTDFSVRLQNLAKRWPSARYSVIKRVKKSDTDNKKELPVVEDSIV